MNKKVIRNVGIGLLYAIWTLAASLGAALVVGLILVASPSTVRIFAQTPVGNLVLAAIVYILAACIVLAPFVLRRKPRSEIIKNTGLQRQVTRQMIIAALSTWGLYFMASIVVAVLLNLIHIPGLDLSQRQDVGFHHTQHAIEYIAAGLALVVLAPFCEEVVFRGYLFGRVRKYNGFWSSAVLTSLTFAVLHGQVNVGIDVFVLSLFLCYLREKFDSIWPGVIVHALKNGLAYGILFILPLYGINLV